MCAQYLSNEFELIPALESILVEYPNERESQARIPPQFVTTERPFNPSDPKSFSEYIEIRDEIVKRTRFIKPDSVELKENYIDNFEKIQVMTEDSTPQNDFFKIFFSNGKSRKFNLKEVPTSYIPSQRYIRSTRIYFRPEYYIKKPDGLIYPFFDGKIRYDFKNTFWLVLWRTKIEVLREIFLYQQAAAAFAFLISGSAGAHEFLGIVKDIPVVTQNKFIPRNTKVNLEKMEQGRPPANMLNQKYSNWINFPEVYLKAIQNINTGYVKIDRNGDKRVIIFMGENTGSVNNRTVHHLEVIFNDKGWYFYPQVQPTRQ